MAEELVIRLNRFVLFKERNRFSLTVVFKQEAYV